MAKAPTIVAGPASSNDNYTISEDQSASGTVRFNVRLNDNSRSTLYSLDDGQAADLLTQDAVLMPQTSRLGATIAITADGQVSYSFSSPQVQSLGAGQTLQDSFLYAIRLQNGSLIWQTVTVTITGTNDAPVAAADVAAVAEDAVTTGSVAGNDVDVDNGAVLTFATTDQIPAGFAMASNGSWAFDGSNAAYQSLAVGETQEFVVQYWVTDQYGASSSSTLTLTVTGSNDLPQVAAATGVVDEDTTGIGRFSYSDVDGDPVIFTLIGEAPAGFTLESNGIWTLDATHPAYQALGAGDFPQLLLNVAATDSAGATVATTLTITLRGANDAPVASPTTAGVGEDFYAWGQLAGSDADQDARLTYELVGDAPAGFEFSADIPGLWQIDTHHADYQWMAQDEFYSLSVAYVVTDEWGASASSTLTLTFRGSNDDPTAAPATATVSEDGFVSGQVVVGDPDENASLTVEPPMTHYIAGLEMYSDGSWIFDANQYEYQALAQGESRDLVINYSVADAEGAYAYSTLTITILGANDPPVTTSQWIEAAENLSASGGLLAFDQDNGAVLTFAVDGEAPDGFELTANGAWYFDGANAAYDHLTYGEVALIEVPFTVTDEFGGSISSFVMLAVTGRNDVATIGGTQAGSVTEAVPGSPGTPSAQGQLSVADPDSPAQFQPVGTPAASVRGYGSFTLTSSGAWSYQLDNANPAVNALNTGQALEDYFTVHTADGSSSVVTITINGRTDLASPPVSTAPDPNDFDALADSSALPGPVNYVGTTANNGAHGSQVGDTMIGMEGSDTLYAHGGNDQLWGDFWDPAISGPNFYIDRLYGQAGNDTLYGGNGGDTLYGGSGDDTLHANGSNGLDAERNYLYGGSGNDRIYGSVGGDEIRGGTGADTITGGGGADRFIYSSLLDTGDTITDFTAGFDAFDFTGLGTNYSFVGQVSSPAQLQPGQVGYVVVGGNTMLYVDGYATEQGADLEITLLGVTSLSPAAVWFG